MDAGSKVLAASYPIVQILWIRYLLLFAVAYWLLRQRGKPVLSGRPWLQLTRGLLLLTEIGLIVYALKTMELADVHAILAIAPLIVTALSALFLGEKVGVHRWSAVAIAFVGMLLVLRPGSGVVQPVAFVVILAALLFALYLVLTRVVGRTDPPDVSLFWIAVTGLLVLSAAVPFFWQAPTSLADWSLFFLVAALGAAAHFCLIKALQLAEASVLQPYSYSILIGAIIVGYLVFGHLPELPTAIGAAIIAGSGLYVFCREQRQRR